MENMGKWQNGTGMESILIFVFLVNININASEFQLHSFGNFNCNLFATSIQILP